MVWMRGEVADLHDDNSDLQLQIDQALAQEVEIAALTRKIDDQEKAAARLEDAATGDQDLIVALLSNRTRIAEVISSDETASAIGRLVWDADQKKVWFVASDLPQRPSGETYQLWVQSGGRYFPLGAFQSDEKGFARFYTVVPEGIASYESAVVTIERAGGSPTREGPTVFFVLDLGNLGD
jgi:anti-sigma-K factor RskA